MKEIILEGMEYDNPCDYEIFDEYLHEILNGSSMTLVNSHIVQTDDETFNKLHKEISIALKSKEGTKRIVEDGASLVGSSPEEFSKFIKSEQDRWAKVIGKAQISLD